MRTLDTIIADSILMAALGPLSSFFIYLPELTLADVTSRPGTLDPEPVQKTRLLARR